MKKDIHPALREVAFTCSCGHTLKLLSTLDKESVHVEVCAQCHPFYTGKQKFIDTAGRLHKFYKKYGHDIKNAETSHEQAK